MKKILYLAVLASSLLAFAAEAKAVSFVDGHEDIPIMDGLTQIESDSVSFGNEEARFIEAYLTGGKTKYKDVEKFYAETLPQLGWNFVKKETSSMNFRRDNEVMEIVLEKNSPTLIRITVKSSD